MKNVHADRPIHKSSPVKHSCYIQQSSIGLTGRCRRDVNSFLEDRPPQHNVSICICDSAGSVSEVQTEISLLKAPLSILLKPMFTFISHGSYITEPFLDCCNSVWWVFMPPPRYFGYCGHWAFQCSAGFGHHGVVAKMEIQRLNNVGRIVFGAWCDPKKNLY